MRGVRYSSAGGDNPRNFMGLGRLSCRVTCPPIRSEDRRRLLDERQSALAKANFDYAIEMYGKAVALAPDNLSFRQSLRGSEYKKYQDNKTGAKLASVRAGRHPQ